MSRPAPIPILPFLEGREGKLVLMRFWSNVDMGDPAHCWDWQLSLTQSGYGRFKIASYTTVGAHRVALVDHTRKDPPDLLALHNCDRPSCVNPHHLRWGTVQDNSDDMKARGRAYNGEQGGTNNGRCKLTNQQFAQIITGLMAGKTNKGIAAELPVGHALVSRIRRGRSWTKEAADLGWTPQPKYASLKGRPL